MSSTTILYTFNEYSLTVSVVVSTALGTFTAVDNKTYPGFAILGGSGNYVYNNNKLFFIIPPQTIANFNVIWAASGAGSGGSSSGIDTNGITIAGDGGAISWNGTLLGPKSFSLQEGAVSGPVTLSSVHGYPPRA